MAHNFEANDMISFVSFCSSGFKVSELLLLSSDTSVNLLVSSHIPLLLRHIKCIKCTNDRILMTTFKSFSQNMIKLFPEPDSAGCRNTVTIISAKHFSTHACSQPTLITLTSPLAFAGINSDNVLLFACLLHCVAHSRRSASINTNGQRSFYA